MPADEPGEDLRQALQALLVALYVGDFRAVLHPDPTRPSGRPVAGSAKLARLVVVSRIVARSMQLQTEGRVGEAWARLVEAAHLLPAFFTSAKDRGRAVLRHAPRNATFETEVAWHLARIIWREQFELDDLRCRFARGLMTAREQLAEAVIEHLFWVDFVPYNWNRERLAIRGPVPDRSRSSICGRGSQLRRLADATACDISQSVWQDIGAFPGLCAEALDRLAERPTPAPWHDVAGAVDLEVRRGRLRAWNHALTRADDLDYWK